jgi:hypothetical protein
MLDVAHAFSRRLRLSAGAEFQRSGGVGHDAIQALPFQVGPRATVSLDWTADRINSVTLSGSTSEARFSIDRTSILSDLRAGWMSTPSSRSSVDAAAGLVFVRSSGADFSSSAFYGAGALGFGWSLPMTPRRALRMSLRLRLAPGVDRLTALAIQTVRGDGAAELSEGDLRLTLSGSEAHVISGAGAGADDLRLETRASWLLAKAWSVEAGASAAWTNQAPFVGWQLQGVVGLRWTARGTF